MKQLSKTIFLLGVTTTIMQGDLFGQKAIGTAMFTSGSITLGPIPIADGIKIERCDGDKVESPRGRNGEALPGCLAKYQVHGKVALPLENPSDGQTIVLIDKRPIGLTNALANKVKITEVRAPEARNSNSEIFGSGYFAVGFDPLRRNMEFLVGLPFTELDITQLTASNQAVVFYGKRWRPKGEGESLIIVTWEKVFGVNVVAEDLKPSGKQAVAETDTMQESMSKIADTIGNGNWTNGLQLAEAALADHPKNSICMVVEDAARFITKTPKHPARSYLDYPYSDKTASDKMLSWTHDLLASSPTNAHYLLLEGIYYIRGRRDFERGTACLEKALSSAPDNVFALSCLAAGYGAQNRLDKAVELSERALRMDPECSQAYDNLGMAAMARGDRTKAEEYFRKAVACPDAEGMDWFNLGSLQVAQGRLQEGRATLLKGLEVSPNLMEIHWNLASVYYNLGQKADCIRECRQVIELAPDSSQATKARNNLRALGE